MSLYKLKAAKLTYSAMKTVAAHDDDKNEDDFLLAAGVDDAVDNVVDEGGDMVERISTTCRQAMAYQRELSSPTSSCCICYR
jgi:hypothetical protein